MSSSLSHGKPLDATGYGRDASDLPSFDSDDRAASRVDPRDWFDHPERPFELEIGSGKGTFLLQQAQLQPETNFLGIEWAKEYWLYAADRFRRHELPNVRMLRMDAVEFIRFRLPDGIVRVVHLYFSDPWPKSRHHKRRVVQDESLAEFHRILEPGGLLHLVTDHDALWSWYEAHLDRNEHLFERREFIAPPSAEAGEVVGTNFERKYRREGRPFHATTLLRR